MSKPLIFVFKDDGRVPNNPTLPALLYKAAIDLRGTSRPEAAIEKAFKANGWGHNMWRDGIFDYVHYHSMIHEALGIARGRAHVRLGGDAGEEVELAAGDVVVLPAGTGHHCLSASEDFHVVGAYPPEGTYNLCRGSNPADRDKALVTIPQVPLPKTDPVNGGSEPLPQLWRAAGGR